MKLNYKALSKTLIKCTDQELILLQILITQELMEVTDQLGYMMLLSELRYRGLLLK